MSPLRVWLVGFGMVGRWLADALDTQAQLQASRFGCVVQVVGIANARDGFVHDAGGLNLRSALAVAAAGQPITAQPGARAWPAALDGLRATEADLLVEVTASPRPDAEPGLSHIREALRRGIPVVTANKWPVAMHGAELAALARDRGVAFRAESTVMSGTPVLSTLTEGLAAHGRELGVGRSRAWPGCRARPGCRGTGAAPRGRGFPSVCRDVTRVLSSPREGAGITSRSDYRGMTTGGPPG